MATGDVYVRRERPAVSSPREKIQSIGTAKDELQRGKSKTRNLGESVHLPHLEFNGFCFIVTEFN